MKKKTIAIMMTAAMVMAMAARSPHLQTETTRKQATRLVFSSLQSTDHWIIVGKVSWKDWKRKASRKETI